jgi:hypothetical protein
MGAIETAVIPVLTPLVEGRGILLTKPKRKKLAEWIALKVLVADKSGYRDAPATPIYDQRVRDEFYQRRVVPVGTRIYLAAQIGRIWATSYHRHSSGLGFVAPPRPPSEHPTGVRNVQTITWGIGKLLIHLSAVTDAEVGKIFRFSKPEFFRRLYPITGADIRWPPAHAVTDHFVDDLAGSLERFLERHKAG